MITYVCQNFGVRDVLGKANTKKYISGGIPFTSDFPNNFSKPWSYSNRMKDC